MFREVRDQLLRHAIGEVFLTRVAGQVAERQHRDGSDRARTRAEVGPSAIRARRPGPRIRPRRPETNAAGAGAPWPAKPSPWKGRAATRKLPSTRRTGPEPTETARSDASPGTASRSDPGPRAPARPRRRSPAAGRAGSPPSSAQATCRKARLPVTISYSTQPSEKMSLRASASSPPTCSGDMYPTVPEPRRRPSASTPSASTSDPRSRPRADAPTKIQDLHQAVRGQEDVLGLDVAMDDAPARAPPQDLRRPKSRSPPPGRQANRSLTILCRSVSPSSSSVTA